MKKLVRDKIPMLIAAERTIKVKKLTHSEAEGHLVIKLHEEAQEVSDAYYNTGGNLDAVLEELADVYEVIVALADRLGFTENELRTKRMTKRAVKGGFDEAFFVDDEL